MTIRKLVNIVDSLSAGSGHTEREMVKEVYGLGFEGAIRDAESGGFVHLDPSTGVISLTDTAGLLILEADHDPTPSKDVGEGRSTNASETTSGMSDITAPEAKQGRV